MTKLNTSSEQSKTAGDMRGDNTMMQLLGYVERFERLQEERNALGDDQKEVMAEVKSLGLDTAILRKVISRRKMDPADRAVADSMVELYENTIQQAEKKQTAASQAEGA